MEDLKKTFVPVGSQVTPQRPVADVTDAALADWERDFEYRLELYEDKPDPLRTMQMPAICRTRLVAECRGSSYYGILRGGYSVNYDVPTQDLSDGIPIAVDTDIANDCGVEPVTALMPIVRVQRQSTRLWFVAVGLAVAVAFCLGKLSEPVVVAKLCPGRCPAPSRCNSNTGRCEGTANQVADALDMDAERNGAE